MKTLLLTTLAVATFGMTGGQALAAYGGSAGSDDSSYQGSGRGQGRQTSSGYQEKQYPSQSRPSRHTTDSYEAPKKCHTDRGDRYEKVVVVIPTYPSRRQSCEPKKESTSCHRPSGHYPERMTSSYPSKRHCDTSTVQASSPKREWPTTGDQCHSNKKQRPSEDYKKGGYGGSSSSSWERKSDARRY